MKRAEIATHIADNLSQRKDTLKSQWRGHRVRAFTVDGLLPDALAKSMYDAFPATEDMRFKESLRERKLISAQMNKHNPLLEEAIYAFQDPRITALLEEITGLRSLEPDAHLYAGGISMMLKDHFLNPHIDNSHDKDRNRYRVLNLLYYVTPGWDAPSGGNLELWDEGPKGKPREIPSRFNRLVVMQTDRHSWHSVNPVRADGRRCCISNYTFSPYPTDDAEYFHVTSFRGRPDQFLRDLALRADARLRMEIRKLFTKGLFKTGHEYKRTDGY